MTKRITIYLHDAVISEVDARGENRSGVISRDLLRLYTLYRQAIREVPLCANEACLLVDALNGAITDAHTAPLLWQEVEDACRLDGLDEKWQVDGRALIEKLKNLSALHCMALVDAAERFWQAEDAEQCNLQEAVRRYFYIRD
ncbi:hypothetical protein V3F56_03505 [Moorellaceae bacterium AZ2]